MLPIKLILFSFSVQQRFQNWHGTCTAASQSVLLISTSCGHKKEPLSFFSHALAAIAVCKETCKYSPQSLKLFTTTTRKLEDPATRYVTISDDCTSDQLLTIAIHRQAINMNRRGKALSTIALDWNLFPFCLSFGWLCYD